PPCRVGQIREQSPCPGGHIREHSQTLVFWMALILGTSIGDLTIPIILVSIVILVFAINDATKFSVRRLGRSRKGKG
ncbi:MAG: hypothetical protein Q7R39_14630, partial [Dehalococcoidia bacterium]|nr:hypothetical protein [Dehalococcoidia bacterium]